MIIGKRIYNPITSLFGDHPSKQLVSGHQKIPPRQHLENESQQLNLLLRRRNPYILSGGRSILFSRRRINKHLRRCTPRRYLIRRLNDWICPQMYIFIWGRIQMKPVSNWLHGKLEICGHVGPLLMTWQASSSVQKTTPWQPLLAFRRWSWHMWSL